MFRSALTSSSVRAVAVSARAPAQQRRAMSSLLIAPARTLKQMQPISIVSNRNYATPSTMEEEKPISVSPDSPSLSTETNQPKAAILTTAEVNISNLPRQLGELKEGEHALAPGVPEQKAVESGVLVDEEVVEAIGFKIELPTYVLLEEQLAVPPFVPDSHNSSSSFPSRFSKIDESSSSVDSPKVVAVSADSTTRHSLHETVDNLTSEHK